MGSNVSFILGETVRPAPDHQDVFLTAPQAKTASRPKSYYACEEVFCGLEPRKITKEPGAPKRKLYTREL